ncbi:unnamed protein product [Bemisia tabaci]|uniref:Ero1-like protein n=1 Tax=Bemisia tabaci TaxID=7038 RepID=A0A9P0F1J5_BEMTA|nr:PREDICTED: ero1-like protein isoform X2 [Bemisia tabaci]CAH0385010.1 unnamed protein product [Bemisia tabaci]
MHFCTLCLILWTTVASVSCIFFGADKTINELCFCKLQGKVDDCNCTIDAVDYFNNKKAYPRISSLVLKDYFRFYKVNLKAKCPFWTDDSRCAMRYCNVKPCRQSDLPPVYKGFANGGDVSYTLSKNLASDDCEQDTNAELSFLNTTLSASIMEDFAAWKAYDDAQDYYCQLPDVDDEAEYVDLTLNPERFTGYKGKSAHRIWNSIYMENCFRPKNSYGAYIRSSKLNGMCLEKRVFYRVVSGLHASINLHLCANYLLSERESYGIISDTGRWGKNFKEFERRFSPAMTDGEGPQWLRNLYFVYSLELRALEKAAPYLEQEKYYTGREKEDNETVAAVNDFLRVVKTFPEHFNESAMFQGGDSAKKLKADFKSHFRNISRIMDCVGCDKCKLWGKLQIQGLGTALKILFADHVDFESEAQKGQFSTFRLRRSEIVALFNSIARLSSSIYELDQFGLTMR